MSKRKSFIVHHDSLEVIDKLTDEQAGKLLKAIKAYQLGEDFKLDLMTDLVFTPFKSQFVRDDEKYQKIVNRNKNNGLKGGRPKTQENPEETKEPSGLSGNPEEPKKPDSDSKSKSDSKSDSKNKIDFSPLAFNYEEIKEFKEIRARKKGAVTQRVVNEHGKQFELSRRRGYSNDDILNEWSNRGWTAYKDEWMKVPIKQRPSQSNIPPADYDPLEALRNL